MKKAPDTGWSIQHFEEGEVASLRETGLSRRPVAGVAPGYHVHRLGPVRQDDGRRFRAESLQDAAESGRLTVRPGGYLNRDRHRLVARLPQIDPVTADRKRHAGSLEVFNRPKIETIHINLCAARLDLELQGADRVQLTARQVVRFHGRGSVI